jgi:WD40 repeat protein
VAVGGNDGKIGIYDTQTLKTIKIWNSFSRVWSIKWFNGGKMLVSGHNDTTIKIWSLEINHSISIILGHRGWVRSVDFSNIGNFIATSS